MLPFSTFGFSLLFRFNLEIATSCLAQFHIHETKEVEQLLFEKKQRIRKKIFICKILSYGREYR